MSRKKGLDIFGVEPASESLRIVTSKSIEGVEGFLKKVCVPALEEFGYLVKDGVRNWRLKNIIKIIEKSEGKLEFADDQLSIKSNPKVTLSIIENGSLSDNDELQSLWAGLLVSSCTKDEQDDENLIFCDLLKQLTIVQARIIKYACEESQKVLFKNTLVLPEGIGISYDEFTSLTSCIDLHRLDRELDHLVSLSLLGSGSFFNRGSGFSADDETLNVYLRPTALALNLFTRSQGFNGSLNEYWASDIITYEQKQEQTKSSNDT